MNYRHRIRYFLVRQLGISYKEAQLLLDEGAVEVNGLVVSENVPVSFHCDVKVKGILVSKAHTYRYYAYHKPAGVECTLNPDVPDNLLQHLPQELHGLFYIGRLDKASEGLLLLTDDGYIHDRMLKPENKVPKEYVVTIEDVLTPDFLDKLGKGVPILNRVTEPCTVWQTGDATFHIILTQGMNRQIRRMCFALGSYVTRLVRIKIGPVELGELQQGQYRKLDRSVMLP